MKRLPAFEAGLFGVAWLVAPPALAQAAAPTPPVPPAASVASQATTPPGARVADPAPAVGGEPPAAPPAEPEAKPSNPSEPSAEAPADGSPEPANPQSAPTTSAAPAFALPAPASPEDNPAARGFSGKLGSHQDHWLAWIGVRNDYVRDASFDLFASNDALTVFSVGAGRTVWVSGDFSLAALGFWEIGSRSEDTRGNEASLRVQRLEVGPEARYHLHYRVYGFGRLGLGAEYLHATLENGLFQEELVSNSWMFAGELTGGAAFQIFGDPAGENRKPRLWLTGEGGYALTSEATLSFAPASGGGGAPERSEADDLGELGLSAPFFRLAVAGSY